MYTAPQRGITLGDFVENYVMQLRRAGSLKQGTTVANVKLNHPTEPTKVKLTFSDQTTATIDIKRPTH